MIRSGGQTLILATMLQHRSNVFRRITCVVALTMAEVLASASLIARPVDQNNCNFSADSPTVDDRTFAPNALRCLTRGGGPGAVMAQSVNDLAAKVLQDAERLSKPSLNLDSRLRGSSLPASVPLAPKQELMREKELELRRVEDRQKLEVERDLRDTIRQVR